MKKHLNKLIICTLFVLTVIFMAVSDDIFQKDSKEQTEVEIGDRIEIPKDYVITDSITLLVNDDNYVHLDETTINAVLKEIVFVEDELFSFVLQTQDDEQKIIFYTNLDLIESEVLYGEESEDVIGIRLAFRTGEIVTLNEGEDVKIYKDTSSQWTFDRRAHIKSEEEELIGVVEDFKFIPTINQKGDVYISHIEIKNKNDEIINLYPHNMDIKSIESDGDLKVYYTGKIFDIPVFNTEGNDNFSIKVETHEDIFVLEKGEEVKLKKNENKGYWELKKDIEPTRYEAVVVDFVFGHSDKNVTSIDYINLELEDSEVQLTMLQTNALHAIPYGNYRKIYKYDGSDKVLTSVEAQDDWMMELYYEDDVVLEVKAGTKLWIYKNEYDIWNLDYEYVPDTEDGEEEDE